MSGPLRKAWPDGARALSGRLKRAATFLRKAGIEIGSEKEKTRKRSRLIRITANTSLSAKAENAGMPSSAPSTSSAPTSNLNGHNGFGTSNLRTVGPGADANADEGSVPYPATVRSKPLEQQAADDVDDADANNPAFAEPKEEAALDLWRARL